MADTQSNMSMLKQAQRLVPPLLPHFHKGQLGRILVVGGSEDYTGAPYFAAMAAALVGADMSHVLCTDGAAPVIKTYSPNLMVHPYLSETSDDLSDKVGGLLDRMHVVLVGPGLGRNARLFRQIEQLVAQAKQRELPLVVDADGLYLLQQQPRLVKEYLPNKVVLTPNVVELGRLLKSALPNNAKAESESEKREQLEALARELRCVLLVKGTQDVITDGTQTAIGDAEGSPRRVSGQGDTLSGALTTFVAWSEAYGQGLWDTEPIEGNRLIVAAWAASSVARTASRLAYAAKGRAMGTTDVNGRVGEAFVEVFP